MYKVHFYNEYISYITSIKYSENGKGLLNEELYSPLINYPTLSKTINTFLELEKILITRDNFYLLGSLVPDIRDYSIPLWLYGNYSYK